jgi:fibrillarin-like rRNA methylase
MFYEINVSKDGQHFFATNERSIRSADKAKEVFTTFKQKFLEEDGFKVTVSLHKESSVYLDW